MSVDELKQIIDSGKPPCLIDIRMPVHYSQGHIEGASNIPLTSFFGNPFDGILDKTSKVVVYCYHGHDSQIARSILQGQGFDADHLDGGIHAWAVQGGVLSNI